MLIKNNITSLTKPLTYLLLSGFFQLSATTASAEPFLNTAPDCSQASVTPDYIWPPNNEPIPLTISGVTDPDNQVVTLETQCIIQDEPVKEQHWDDGRYDGDGLGTDTPVIRGERHMKPFYNYDEEIWEKSQGRVYEVIFKATDTDNAMCSGKVRVVVPPSEDGPVKDNGAKYPSVPGGVNCAGLPINNPPIIYSSPVTEARVGSTYQYAVQGHDPDQEALTFQLLTNLEGMTINTQSGLIDWIPSSIQEGQQTVTIQVEDNGGLTAIQTYVVTVQPSLDELSANIIANPTTGTSPLTVRFSPEVQNNNVVITQYSWDFDGNGTYDVSDSFGAPKTYTYSGNPGDTFTATLRVRPSTGEPLIATKVITISNEGPNAYVSLDKTNGHIPLDVNFTVVAEDPQGISSVSIDYEGDGTFDETLDVDTLSGSWNFQHSYADEGSYVATVSVVDSFGAETIISNSSITVDANDPLDPIIQLTASPQSGNVPLSTTLSATAELFDGGAISSWRWDLDGDGSFETTGGTAASDSVSYTYQTVDDHYPVVEITTDTGRTAIASLRIHTEGSGTPTLSIPNSEDTLNVDAAQISDFTVTLPFTTSLEVWIENAGGTRVQTIQEPAITANGTHSFNWDGRDLQNEIVASGDYYVVIGYEKYGTQYEVDLRTTTGGALSYYRRTTSNPRTFDRLEKPLKVDFAVSDPAQVTFFWQISFGARLMTLMEHERMGRGQYSLYWNGEYPSGKKVPSSVDRLMPGILRYTLPNNVIFVKESPRIDNYNLASTIIHDPRREPVGLDLELSKTSTVELIVSDMEKGVDVATRQFISIPSGTNKIYWDGKNDDDQYLAPGDYRIGVRSIDDHGNRSLFWYRTQRLAY